MNTEEGLHIFVIILLLILVIVTIRGSFLIPIRVRHKITYLYENHTLVIFFWLVLLVLIAFVELFLTFAYQPYVDFKEPFTQPGIFLFSLVLLLLSNFFIVGGGENANTTYEAHPLIFTTAVYLVLMTIILSICVNVKYYYRKKNEIEKEKLLSTRYLNLPSLENENTIKYEKALDKFYYRF